MEGKEKHFRVGGKLDYRNTPENFNELIDKYGWISFPYILNLKNAVRAEIQIEKNLCHEGTRGLSINFNGVSSLPPEMAKLRNLEKFLAGRNRLSELPADIVQITPYVFFNNNHLCNLPAEVEEWIGKQGKTSGWKKSQRCR